MGDDSQSCPRCKSLMVSGGGGDSHPGALPRWLHPLAVLVVLILASAGLLAIDLKPWGGSSSPSRVDPVTSGEVTMPGPEEGGPDLGRVEPSGAVEVPATDPGADLYKQVNDYVAGVQDALAQADAIAAELDRLAKQDNANQAGAMRDKLAQLQHFTNQLRSMVPPEALNSAHTRLSNSLALRSRAYRSLSMFAKSGDTKRLDRATRDLETAQQTKQEAMNEIIAYRDKIPAPAAPPAEPEPTPEPTPEPAPPQPQLPPPGIEPQPGLTQDAPPDDGVGAEEGEAVEDGGSISPEGEEPLPEDMPLVPDDGSLPQMPRLNPR